MCCPKCNGYLVRDLGFEAVTHTLPGYHCVNCGNYIDLCILKNRHLTLEEQNATAHKRHGYHVSEPDTFAIGGAGHVLLAGSGVCDL